MAKRPDVHVGVSATFMVLIAAVPLVQAVSELLRAERPQALEVFCGVPTPTSLRAYESDLEAASVVAGRLRPWVQYAQFDLLGAGGEKAAVGRDGWWFYKPGLEYLTRRPPPPQPGDEPNDPLRTILAFRDQLAARGIRLVVMPVPNKESIYPEQLTRRAASADVVVCRQTRELLGQLHMAGVDVVNLFEVFGSAKRCPGTRSEEALYLVQDTHWSPAGLAVAAKAAAGRLLGRGRVQPGTVPYGVLPAPVQRVGDVVRMLQAPPIERLVGPEAIACEQVFRGDTGEPYKDAPDAEVLVLGDSFLRIYEQDEPGAAGFVAHLARARGGPVTSLVSDGGGATLVRQELSRRPRFLAKKRVVLWGFVERDIRFAAEGWPIVPVPEAGPPRPPLREEGRAQRTMGGAS
ncbi:MAG: hypothetical protein NTU94_15745 [Planctomycetota bacterium]|nr:hypothetical protein [Planctomycetota bacterium]